MRGEKSRRGERGSASSNFVRRRRRRRRLRFALAASFLLVSLDTHLSGTRDDERPECLLPRRESPGNKKRKRQEAEARGEDEGMADDSFIDAGQTRREEACIVALRAPLLLLLLLLLLLARSIAADGIKAVEIII